MTRGAHACEAPHQLRVNHGYTYRSRVPVASAGLTLLAHLARAYGHSTPATWAARLAAGEVTLDDAPAHGGETLRAGQRVAWRRPPWNEPDVPREFGVAYDDASMVVAVKPAGLPTMPNGGFLDHTLWALVRGAHGDVHPVHRLGRFTSGLVVFARTPEAARTLAAGWHDRVMKDYRALVSGHPSWTALDVTQPIGPVPHPRLGTVHAASAVGRAASSTLRVVERREHATLCDVRIHTGRPHQIRIHAAVAGHPLVGDPLYAPGGVPMALAPGLPGDGGYWLHAHRLTLTHPARGDVLALTAEPPASLRPAG